MYLHMQYCASKKTARNKRNNIKTLLVRWRASACWGARVFSDELRPFGLKATQLNLLAVVDKIGPIRRIGIAKPFTLTHQHCPGNSK